MEDNCVCGHEPAAHEWNTNAWPEGEPQWEMFECSECMTGLDREGNMISDCMEYKKADDMMDDPEEMGECDTCEASYELASRDGRCGDCGDCSECCTHNTEQV